MFTIDEWLTISDEIVELWQVGIHIRIKIIQYRYGYSKNSDPVCNYFEKIAHIADFMRLQLEEEVCKQYNPDDFEMRTGIHFQSLFYGRQDVRYSEGWQDRFEPIPQNYALRLRPLPHSLTQTEKNLIDRYLTALENFYNRVKYCMPPSITILESFLLKFRSLPTFQVYQ